MKTRERNELFDTLPGIRLPVAEVTSVLSRMWHPEAFTPGEPPTEYRASRMNLILHFGLKTSVREAEEKFDVAVRFALRHPCRLVVLCPQDEVQVQREQLLEGKLFSQCHLGGSMREISCLEALILGYPTQESGFLENQVSVWLESDLPTYHWLHRVPEMPIRKFYLSFMRTFRRVVYDSSLEGHDYSRLGWPEGDFLQDLAYARTLPLRQSAGQFLSRFAPPCNRGRKLAQRSLGNSAPLPRYQEMKRPES